MSLAPFPERQQHPLCPREPTFHTMKTPHWPVVVVIDPPYHWHLSGTHAAGLQWPQLLILVFYDALPQGVASGGEIHAGWFFSSMGMGSSLLCQELSCPTTQWRFIWWCQAPAACFRLFWSNHCPCPQHIIRLIATDVCSMVMSMEPCAPAAPNRSRVMLAVRVTCFCIFLLLSLLQDALWGKHCEQESNPDLRIPCRGGGCSGLDLSGRVKFSALETEDLFCNWDFLLSGWELWVELCVNMSLKFFICETKLGIVRASEMWCGVSELMLPPGLRLKSLSTKLIGMTIIYLMLL